MEGEELQGLATGTTTIPAAANGNVAAPLQQQEHAQHPIQQQGQPGYFEDIIMNSVFLSGDNQGTKWNGGSHVDANINNKNLFAAMTANTNSHSLNDPSIQETLSPFFQPFGIDVAHLPMTNPPIFQSSLTRYDEPIRRRRISISNGQISQLGEDLETVENLYNTQPPPLPQRIDSQQQKQNHYYELGATEMTPLQNGGSIRAPVPHFNVPMTLSAIPPWGSSHKQALNQSQQILPDEDEEEKHEHSEPIISSIPGAVQMNSAGRAPSSSSSSISSDNTIFGSKEHRNPIPGTNAWKRARLLERNRIAASKCRQRKKVAQLQLQKDFDILERENKTIKKKLDYYEKLVSKFKRFSEAHLKKCDGTERETLEIIEEMLMIDSGIREVDDAGLVVKMEEK